MALEENTNGNGFYMPVAPAGGYGNGGFGGDWGWIILLLLCGWGGMGFGGGFGGYGNMALGYDFPWILNGQNRTDNLVSSSFDHAATQAALGDLNNAVTAGFGNMATQLCGGFAGVNAAINNATMADMNRSFALQSQFADCCCENRLATCQTQNIVQSEGNATRFADANNTRDIIESQTSGTRAILDKLCDLELSAKNDTIAQLRSELLYARGQASQDVQTAAIQAGQRALANEVEQYVAPKAIPAYVVQNPNCCTNACGCGCGIA